MKEMIKIYLRKLLKYGTQIKENDTLIVIVPDMDKAMIEVFLELQGEFKLRKIIFKDRNYKRIYHLLKNIDIDMIENYIPYIEIDSSIYDTKFIVFSDDSLCVYENELLYSNDLETKYERYLSIDKDKNSRFYELYYNCFITIGVCATKEWASLLYGNKNMKKKLWKDLFKTIPLTNDEMKFQLDKLNYIKNYLNGLKIKELYLNTKLGTDLKVGLSNYSVWANNFDSQLIRDNGYIFNFPSYEIYTAPDMYLADGKIVITKPSSIYGIEINSGEITFSKGRVIFSNSDNGVWDKMILIKDSKLYRIGEIALVSTDSIISGMNKRFHNILLDENAGCHLALGNSLDECNSLQDKFSKEKYNFYDSLFHQDLVFGDSSINVECKTFTGKKKILINDGKWQI